MSSPARLAANRLNALRSTGPRTPAGKLASSANALRHGLLAHAILLRDEDPAEFDLFNKSMLAALQPVGPLEDILAQRVVAAAWRLDRAARIEAGLVDARAYERMARDARATARNLERAFEVNGTRESRQCELEDRPLLKALEPELDAEEGLRSHSVMRGRAFADASVDLNTLIRYEITIERGMYRALHELQRLQAVRTGQSVPPPAVLHVDVATSDSCETNPMAPTVSALHGPCSRPHPACATRPSIISAVQLQSTAPASVSSSEPRSG